jgi:NADH:ubiquinone oxidoreductase subunit H
MVFCFKISRNKVILLESKVGLMFFIFGFFFFFLLLGLGFFIIVERKILGLINLRLSLIKVLFLGYLFFLVDFLKLILKELVEVYVINLVFFFLILLIFLGSLIM